MQRQAVAAEGASASFFCYSASAVFYEAEAEAEAEAEVPVADESSAADYPVSFPLFSAAVQSF